MIDRDLKSLIKLIQEINKIPGDTLNSYRQAVISDLKDQARKIYDAPSLPLPEAAIENLKKNFNDFKQLEKHLNQFGSIHNQDKATDEYGSVVIASIQTAKKNAYYRYSENRGINECIKSFDETIDSLKKRADKDENFRPSLIFFSDYQPARLDSNSLNMK